jgi:hypothetical protein
MGSTQLEPQRQDTRKRYRGRLRLRDTREHGRPRALCSRSTPNHSRGLGISVPRVGTIFSPLRRPSWARSHRRRRWTESQSACTQDDGRFWLDLSSHRVAPHVTECTRLQASSRSEGLCSAARRANPRFRAHENTVAVCLLDELRDVSGGRAWTSRASLSRLVRTSR